MARGGSEADVIVIGGGLAGHCAALAANEAGADVVLLEKQPDTGGSTVLSGGFFALAGTSLQRQAGISDTPDLLLADLREVGGPDADEALIRAYAAGQPDLVAWLERVGARFTALELSAGQSVARSHCCDASALMASLAGRLADGGRTEVRRGTAATRLVRDGQDGAVTGLLLSDASGELIPVGASGALRAKGGVVIATGGFSRSEDLLRLFAPGQAEALRIGGAGSVGDGLRMAWRLGAGLRDMGQIKGTFGTHPATGTERHRILLAFYVGAIIVNQDGRRFVDESDAYKIIGDACLRQSGHVGFQIFDQGVMERSDPGVPLFDFAPARDEGLLLAADGLPELAAQIGVPATALADTVARYNAGVDLGTDAEFGRRGLCNGAGIRPRIERPPFYAYPSTSVVLATYCGLDVGPTGQVRDVEGRDIEGLWAAGEVTGGFHGRSYMTGTSLGKAAFFGRAAGRAAAERAERNRSAA